MSLKSNEYPWCIMDANKYPDGKQSFICTRCGQRHAVSAEGMSVDTFLRLGEAFCSLHSDCKEQEKKDG
jgi:hypothetical protein